VTGTLIAIVIILWAATVKTMRMGDNCPLPHVLPFCDGGPPSIFDLGGCAVLAAFFFFLWTICTLPIEARGERRVFRHSWWLIPLSLVFAAYVRRNVEPSIHWRTLLEQSHMPDPERFSQFCVLIVTCAAILAVVYVWRRG
jgi:hypothetical protein